MNLAAFAAASTTRAGFGAWAHPATDVDVVSARHYIDLARTVEAAGFDFLFFDDRLATPAAFGDSPAQAARLGSRAIKLDLTTILGLVSAHTATLGLGATYSTTYYTPFHIARAFATIDHLSGGRALWNVVTSLNTNEAQNMGLSYPDPDTRYDRADEFMEITTRLWESWERDALRMDREAGVFADPDKVHEINYRGETLHSRGPLTVPRPPQGWPLILQAGQSGRGMRFAARWADLIFTGPADIARAREHYAQQQELFEAVGRPRSAARILPAVQVVVAETSEIARAKNEFFAGLSSPEEELVVMSEQASFDFSAVPLDEPLDDGLLDTVTGSRGILKRHFDVARSVKGPEATLRDLVELQSRHGVPRFVGTAAEVADGMEEWFETSACDGFAIAPLDTPGSFEAIGRLLIPELRRRGRLPQPDDVPPGTLRDRLGVPRRDSV